MKFSVFFSFFVVLLAQFSNSYQLLGQSENPKASSSSTKPTATLSDLLAANPDQYQTIISQLVKENDDSNYWNQKLSGKVEPSTSPARKEKLKAGWSQWEATDSKGVSRPYQVFLPKSVASGTPATAVICHIHGAVGRPDFGEGLGSPAACGYAPFIWPKVAEKENFIIVCPQGRTECSWWTDNGVRHIRATLRDLRRSMALPEDSIFCAGFSDGGSGCYYLSMTGSEPFAGFIALNGNPIVAAKASKKQIYLHNMSTAPFFSAMTHNDTLYPSKMILPHMTKAIELGADVTVVAYPKMNHQPSYFGVQTDAIVDFIKKNKRPTTVNQSRWVAADKNIAAGRFVDILEFGKTSSDADELPDGNVMSTPGRVKTGIRISRGERNGKIARITEDSAAAKAGIRPGDVLLSVAGKKVGDSRTLRQVMEGKNHGDTVNCEVSQNGETKSFTLQTKPFVSSAIYDRSNSTSFVDCKVIEGKNPSVSVSSRNVTKLRIWLPKSLGDKKNVAVAVNGQAPKSMPVNRLSTKELLLRFAKSGDQMESKYSYVDVVIN